ncbi:Tat pathway signal sequence domain protein [Isoptericola sp. 178]|uniref:Tat pathway signal sequence domain protein n=1 Tax=Isoptericola sp. 178 TaxID=3064651 RepID=UPI0027139867|nr:Tat pathway signal sequence domain protein [Isoptericola sp. 178]MDO8143213.1 Tat pathway signal sequence domain protein [Isoptericola sp. 178]
MPGPSTSPLTAAVSRRGVLIAGAAGAATLAAGMQAWASPATRGGVAGSMSSADSLERAHAFLGAMTDAYPEVNSGPRMAQSYADQLGLFSTAFVYDVALTICASLAGGHVGRATTLADGLLFAQQNDPTYDDGRLRQGYNTGPYTFYDGTPQPYGLELPDGTANIGWQFGFLGTAVGDMAWPGIALLHTYSATGDGRYLDGAVRIGEWILDNTWSERPLGGFSFGVDGGNNPIPNGSTEHNIDCVAFFRQLEALEGGDRWRRAQEHARAFVDIMWDRQGGFFYTGTNDGVEINRDPLPLDPATWGWLALQAERYGRSVDWAADDLATRDVAGEGNSQLPGDVTISGVTFSSASLVSTASYNGLPVHQQGVWLEGTGQLACAMADRGRGTRDSGRAHDLLDEIRVAQNLVGAGQTVGGDLLPDRGGVVAASSLIDTGFGFGYFQIQHTGATSWYVMAAEGVNPLQVGGLGV